MGYFCKLVTVVFNPAQLQVGYGFILYRDSNALYLSGYELKDTVEMVEIETANGIIESEVFEVNQMHSLGIIKKREIQDTSL